jgi:hydrogenase maturation protein HypF
MRALFKPHRLQIWINHTVPPNDGGISLGQAALAAFGNFNDAKSATIERAVYA